MRALLATLLASCGPPAPTAPPCRRVPARAEPARTPAAPGPEVVRERVTIGGRDFIEVRTPSVALSLTVPSPPPSCRVVARPPIALRSAGRVVAAMHGARALLATDTWEPQGTHVWLHEAGAPTRHEWLPGLVSPHVFVHAGDLVLGGWRQGLGTVFLRYPPGSRAAPSGHVRSLGSLRGAIDSGNGALYVWHTRTRSEAGDPIATLTRISPDGSTASTSGDNHGAILGVVPAAETIAMVRAPLFGERGSYVTVQTLSPELATLEDAAVRERIAIDQCSFFALEHHADHGTCGRLVCRNGDTWIIARGIVHPDYAFGANVLAYAGGALPLAARRDGDEIVVESFGGALARVRAEDADVRTAALASDGDRALVAWITGPDHDAPERVLRSAVLECTPRSGRAPRPWGAWFTNSDTLGVQR